MDIKRNVLFFLDLEKDKPDAKIRMRIRYNGGVVVNFNVGYRADVGKWIKEAQRCKSNSTHGKKKIPAAEIDREIQRLKELANKTFKIFEDDAHIPNADEFRIAFNNNSAAATGKVTKEKNGLFDIFDEFVRIEGTQKTWTLSTYAKFSTLRKHLQAYNPKLSISRLTENDLQGFVKYFGRV